MSKSIRVSEELAANAESAAKRFHRSPPQQIEHWARIGRVLEPILSYPLVDAIKTADRDDLDRALSEVETPESEDRTRRIIESSAGEIVTSD